MRRLALQAMLAFALVLAAPSAGAEEEEGANPDWFPGEFTANVAFATDYPFRGISQTNERGAIQGGIDYAYAFSDAIGAFAGGWASNVDFQDGDEAQAEFDIYGGVAGAVGDLAWDFSVIYYEYPGAKSSRDYDFWDFGPSLGYDFGPAAVSVQYLWSPDYFAGSGDSHYVVGGVEVPMPEGVLPTWLGLGFSANLGYQDIDEESTFGTRDYVLWDVGTTVSAFGLDVDLRYYDTDLSRDGCFGGGKTFGDLCEARFVAAVSKSF